MTAFTEKLDKAAGAALCEGLTVAGQSLIGAGAVSLVFGGAGVVPISLGAAALMTSAAGCNWDPEAPGPDPSGPPISYCAIAESPTYIVTISNGIETNVTASVDVITKFEFTRRETDPIGTFRDVYDFRGTTPEGAAYRTELILALGLDNTAEFVQRFEGDPTCKVPDTPGGTDPDIPPTTYTDPEDGCTLIVNWKGLSTDEQGHVSPVFKIEAGPEVLRAEGGGIIGGCNFEPVIYTGNPGGPGEPPFVGPWDPTWDGDEENPWAEFLREIAAGVLGAGLANALSDLFDAPYSGATYRLVSVCETDSSGEPISQAVEEVIPDLPINDAILTRLDALVPLLQGQKDFKQPICEPPAPEGDFRTISFRSEQVSPGGKSCLRKRLRYRSISGIGLDGLIDHWKDFVWSAGPVTVKHRGSTWGTITVWASSIDEGKRVIRHAAAEAGIDADQTGRWQISGSSSTRLGMSGTMKIDITGGYYWITERDGSDNRPIVGKT